MTRKSCPNGCPAPPSRQGPSFTALGDSRFLGILFVLKKTALGFSTPGTHSAVIVLVGFYFILDVLVYLIA